jgi:leader peptidase (prepilin peptidase) / N-methyltransferase
MPRRRKKRPNWPYRLAWGVILGSIALYIGLGTLFGVRSFGSKYFDIYLWVALVSSCFSASIAAWFMMVGASIGSFLNVVAYRLPLGRTIGGHSGCPYCCSPIATFDNIPVLAWIKLRGRCRNCHLPISPQYPIIEFLVGMVFLSVFFTEFRTGGWNLPGLRNAIEMSQFQPTLVMRIVCYLVGLSGLIVAAMITLKGQRVPLRLFAWCLLPQVICTLIVPETTIIPWTEVIMSDIGPFDALATIALGFGAGVALAITLSPIFIQSHHHLEVNLKDSNYAIRTWIASMALSGGLFGWQSMLSLAWVIAITWCVGSFEFGRCRWRVLEIASWIWLGVLIYRSCWRWILDWNPMPDSWPIVLQYAVSFALLALFCKLVTLAHLYQKNDFGGNLD